MSDIAIRVENLGKQYRIGKAQQHHDTLRDAIAAGLTIPLRRSRRDAFAQEAADGDILWALKDVSFDVKHGEVLGIIGRNGAGKSTLLKILSRITEPTTGRAVVNGRVGSLLEVGTGFHPELTGRENIYLNGAILGMKRREIDRKFDDIVAFAEIEKFLDTPVKRYSSGMYVRLAFAVAAHMEPEVLLVDEVLAVGDAAFRKKSLSKMGSVTREGRTVLFVSHDMTSIAMLCKSCVMLEGGAVKLMGPTERVTETYMRQTRIERPHASWELDEAPGDDLARILAVRAASVDGAPSSAFNLSEPVALMLDYWIGGSGGRVNPVFSITNSAGLVVFSTSNYYDPEWGACSYRPGVYRGVCVVPGHVLNEGNYFATAMIVHEAGQVRAHVENAVEFWVDDDGMLRGDYVGGWRGVVRPNCSWRVVPLNTATSEDGHGITS